MITGYCTKDLNYTEGKKPEYFNENLKDITAIIKHLSKYGFLDKIERLDKIKLITIDSEDSINVYS